MNKKTKCGIVLLLLVAVCAFVVGCGKKELVNYHENDSSWVNSTQVKKDQTEKTITDTTSTKKTASDDKSDSAKQSLSDKEKVSDQKKTSEDNLASTEQKAADDNAVSTKKETLLSNKASQKKGTSGKEKKLTNQSASSKKSTSSKKSVSKKETTSKKAGDKYVSKSTGKKKKDAYQTNTVPAGKQEPVEPQQTVVDKSVSGTCSLTVECSAILQNMDKLKKEKKKLVPQNGVIYQNATVTFYDGESVADILLRVMKSAAIPVEYNTTPGFNSVYIEGINNIYEMDCGELSGWQYSVNDWSANYGASRYVVQDQDRIVWHYTCDLGNDIQ